MKITKNLKRLRAIHEHIKNETTGRPREFAKKLNLSTSSLYLIIDELKNKGLPIKFSRKLGTYTYTGFCELEIEYSVILITENGRIEISNGEN